MHHFRSINGLLLLPGCLLLVIVVPECRQCIVRGYLGGPLKLPYRLALENAVMERSMSTLVAFLEACEVWENFNICMVSIKTLHLFSSSSSRRCVSLIAVTITAPLICWISMEKRQFYYKENDQKIIEYYVYQWSSYVDISV